MATTDKTETQNAFDKARKSREEAEKSLKADKTAAKTEAAKGDNK